MKENITLALEKDLLRQLRVIAAQRATSVSRMLSDELMAIADRDRAYRRSKKQALKYLESGFHLGGRPADRDALHER